MPRKPSLSRRSLLRGAAGAGAAGLAAGALGTTSAPGTSTASARSTDDTAKTTGPLVVHVRDARTGDMEVFAGTAQTRLRDRDLAARIAGAVR